MCRFKKLILIALIDVVFISPQIIFAQNNETWNIFINDSLQEDKAIILAVEDLQKAGEKFGIQFNLTSSKVLLRNSILMGSAKRNKLVAGLVKEGMVRLQEIDNPQGYEIKTIRNNGGRVIIISTGSILGDIYGLYWVWDRLKVNSKIPDMNIRRNPKLEIRYTQGNSKEAIRNALRYGATWVTGGISSNHLVPWDHEPERSDNEKNRKELRNLIKYAHDLHLKFFVYEDEFSFHPTLLEEFGATLSPDDPAFWDAVQAKYRRLLQVMPEIDGIRIRTGEATRVGGSYQAFDVMHDGEYCDWSLAKRYRTFVKKMYDIIVGEFNKIYYQRTWVVNAHEQHSMAAVYKEIFSDDVPVKNLYLSPYLSTTDRYFFQPYNPTFNLTPHNMVVLLAPLDYHGHSGAKIFPTFPGTYYQGGLKLILTAEKTNLKGVDFGVPINNNWDSWNVTAYTASRMAWNPNEDLRNIARDFSAMYFGLAAADDVADIFLLSPNAYKYGIYIEPVVYGEFSSLRHLRLTTFPVKGLPQLDNGKKHIDFLYDIYLRCSPWKTETLLYLDHGLDIAKQMRTRAKAVNNKIPNSELATHLVNSVELTWWLVYTNNLYVKTFFNYFEYRDNPTDDNKKQLEKRSAELQQAMKKFLNTPNCVYRLDGMEQLLRNVKQILKNLPRAKEILANAPNYDEMKSLIAELQAKSEDVLKANTDKVVKIVHWRGRVDGRDVVKIHADKLEIEHLRYDPIVNMDYEFSNPLPAKEYSVIVKDIQSRSLHPFVLEQPSADNEFTVSIYLSDSPEHGYSKWEFELYYLENSPAKLGLTPPWE